MWDCGVRARLTEQEFLFERWLLRFRRFCIVNFIRILRSSIVYTSFILNYCTNFTWICRFVYLLTINLAVVIVLIMFGFSCLCLLLPPNQMLLLRIYIIFNKIFWSLCMFVRMWLWILAFIFLFDFSIQKKGKVGIIASATAFTFGCLVLRERKYTHTHRNSEHIFYHKQCDHRNISSGQ